MTSDGFLLQLQGRKKILLVKPNHNKYMIPYPHDSFMFRRSKVYEDVTDTNVRKKWRKIFPDFKKAKIFRSVDSNPT